MSSFLTALTLSLLSVKSPAIRERGVVIEGNGGEHITNEHNPWFLNGSAVRYCIAHDPDSFSLASDLAQNAIEEAFKSWISILEPISRVSRIQGPILLSKKKIDWLALDFEKVDCRTEHELEFQLGKRDSSLEDILKYSAKDTLALSIRDDYSDETGRGRGRIWFAADLGDLRYSGPNPGRGFWKLQKNFFNVVMHELGHVFGIRHTTAGFMSADFPAKVIHFGMNSVVGLDSFIYDYRFCGKLLLQEEAGRLMTEAYGLDIGLINRVCLLDTYDRPSSFPLDESFEYLELAFSIQDGSERRFPLFLNKKSESNLPILGQFLGELPGISGTPYLPWYLANFQGPFSGRGVQKVERGRESKNSSITIETPFPGLVTVDVGLENGWKSFTIVKDAPDVHELFEIDEKLRPRAGTP